MNIVTLFGYALAIAIMAYMMYVVLREVLLEFMLDTSKYRLSKVYAVPAENDDCGITEPHKHVRVVDKLTITDDGVKKRCKILYYFCPKTNKVVAIHTEVVEKGKKRGKS